jgi:hypothetical protein
LEQSFLGWAGARLAGQECFKGVEFHGAQDAGTLTIPALVIECDHAEPMEPREALLYEANVRVHVLSLAEEMDAAGNPVDGAALHEARQAALEAALAVETSAGVSCLITELQPPAAPAGLQLTVYRVEMGTSEGQIEGRHWRDTQNVELWLQVTN